MGQPDMPMIGHFNADPAHQPRGWSARPSTHTHLGANAEGSDGSLAGIWDFDIVGQTLMLSPAARAALGLSDANQISIADVLIAIHPDDLAKVQAAYRRATDPNERAPIDIECRTVAREDGTLRWVEVRGRTYFDEQGRCVHVSGSASEIGGRGTLQAREALGEPVLAGSLAEVRVISEFLHIMVWSALPDGTPDFRNEDLYRYVGLDADVGAQTDWLDLIHPDDRARAAAVWQESVCMGGPHENEYRLRHRSGQYRWVLSRGAAKRGARGAITRWFGTCIDIEELVEARGSPGSGRRTRTLEHDWARLSRNWVWNTSPDLLCILTHDGTFGAINPAWTRLLGWGPADLVARPAASITHPDDLAAGFQALSGTEGDYLPHYESRMLHKDGGYRWFCWAAFREGHHVYASGRHITAEKHAAEALARSEALLRQSQKMEAVGQLTGGIAHDFNNLLQAVSGCLETLSRRHVHADEGQRLIRQAEAAVDRGATLTRQLLAFAREQQLAPRSIDVNATLSGSCELITRSFGAAAMIEWQLAEDTWPAMADPNQLDIALLNLLLNARDAMPFGGTITVATGNVLDPSTLPGDLAPGDYVRLSVSDTGAGMSEAVQARAFEPFFTTKGIGRGTGLGLSQVYGFARQSGGTVRITSAPGHGTTVDIVLPRAPGTEASALKANPAEVVRRAGTILVVDDDFDVREQTAASLEDCGYRVIEADSGPVALRILAEEPVDLLLVDYAMPGMNGAEVVRLGRHLRADLKVLFMTGYADVDALRCYASPQDIIRKPFRLAALTTHVDGVMSRPAVSEVSRLAQT
jgi:PAS domain S-box-containing protein